MVLAYKLTYLTHQPAGDAKRERRLTVSSPPAHQRPVNRPNRQTSTLAPKLPHAPRETNPKYGQGQLTSFSLSIPLLSTRDAT